MTRTRISARGPDRRAALEQYRRRAQVYDREMAPFESIRRLAVASLELRPGDVVFDLGCGTGLSLPLIRRGIGPTGRIVGVEQSPEMLAQARRRVARHGWIGVSLLCAPVETADLAVKADAALFHFTHDVLQQPQAVANVLRHLKPGARVVASGLKWAAPAPLRPVNLFVLSAALHSVTSLDGMDRPWGLLEQRLGRMTVRPRLFGGAYVASGVYVPSSRAARRSRGAVTRAASG